MTAGARGLRRPSVEFTVAMLLAILAAFVGGASRNARVPLMVVELASAPVMVLAIRRMILDGRRRDSIWSLALIALSLAVPLIQLIPLPPELWLKAPGQEPRFTALIDAGVDLGWRPLSLNPTATLAAIPALFPPAAMFLVALPLDRHQRRQIAAAWIVAALAGLPIGLAQIAQPDGGWAYPYSETSQGSLVGWFANRNHEAAMLLALAPLAAVLATGRGAARWIGAAFLLIVLVAIGAVQSRAGILLAGPVVILTAAVILRQPGLARRRWVWAAAAAVVLVSVFAVATLALTPILARFGADSGPEFRYRAWPLIWREAQLHLPFGSGVGSFDRVFRAIEPLNLVVPVYFNHAHNDYLELWLEAGWFGAAAIVALAAWFALHAWGAWRGRESSLARAASVGVVVLAAMSWVDYPLRTESLAVLVAFLLAVMTPTEGTRPP